LARLFIWHGPDHVRPRIRTISTLKYSKVATRFLAPDGGIPAAQLTLISGGVRSIAPPTDDDQGPPYFVLLILAPSNVIRRHPAKLNR